MSLFERQIRPMFNELSYSHHDWNLQVLAASRADQTTGGALLEFPMRTAMHGKSRVSSAISVCDN